MDQDVEVGVGPAERARNAGGDGSHPSTGAGYQRAASRTLCRSLLVGEDLKLVSRKLAVMAVELSGWREAFLVAGEALLEHRPADACDDEIGRVTEKVGD